MSLIDKFIQRVSSRPPDFIIQGGRSDDDPAVLRWWVIPRNRWFNVCLHKFLQDDGQDLHDHPWNNVSCVLRRGYSEQRFVYPPVEGQPLPPTYLVRRDPFRLGFRQAEEAHQVVLDKAAKGTSIPCWSLFFTGHSRRMWGFWCAGNGRAHWKPYTEYTAPDQYGKTGAGCGD